MAFARGGKMLYIINNKNFEKKEHLQKNHTENISSQNLMDYLDT